METVNLVAVIEDSICKAEKTNDTLTPPAGALPAATTYAIMITNSKTEQLLAFVKARDTHLQQIENDPPSPQGS